MQFQWKIKWQLEHLGTLGTMGKMARHSILKNGLKQKSITTDHRITESKFSEVYITTKFISVLFSQCIRHFTIYFVLHFKTSGMFFRVNVVIRKVA